MYHLFIMFHIHQNLILLSMFLIISKEFLKILHMIILILLHFFSTKINKCIKSIKTKNFMNYFIDSFGIR